MIASLHLEGHSIGGIQRLLASWNQPRSYNTIKSFLDRWTTRGGDYSNDKATGRPTKLSKDQREMIKAEVKRRGGVRVGGGGTKGTEEIKPESWEELRDEVAPGVSTRTLKRVLNGDYDSDEEGAEKEKEKESKKAPVKKRKAVVEGKPEPAEDAGVPTKETSPRKKRRVTRGDGDSPGGLDIDMMDIVETPVVPPPST